MNKKKKVYILIASICIIGIILFLLWPHKGGNTKHVNRNIMAVKVYSEEDIAGAMDIVEKKFKHDFDGCTLTDLWYDEAFSVSSSDGWAKQYTAKEAIVLLSNFKVGPFGGDGSLNPNDTYTDWQWILVRDKDSRKWKLVTWGYG